MRVSARDKFTVLRGNACVRSEGWTGRWSEAEGSRLLPCSRAKPETLAVMRSRDNCAVPAGEAATALPLWPAHTITKSL